MNNKITIPIAIIIASVIIGLSYYFVEIKKQESIERQQTLKLMDEKQQREAQIEQEKKEYVVKRKKDCYELEQTERKKYNNVDGSFYDQESDLCKVRYINKNWEEGGPLFSGYNEKTKKYEEGKYFTNEF